MIDDTIIYGPVPSRRLGRSLGVNNIPAKTCSYSCVYCQIGRTNHMIFKRKEFYDPDEIFELIKKKLDELKNKKIPVDYVSFVPDGEPTLDINLGREIMLIKQLGYKVAVISNSSMIIYEDVRKDLVKADLVSLKIDAVNMDIFKKINRPLKNISLDEILEGIKIFSKKYDKKLLTETMLIKDINDGKKTINEIAGFIKKIKPYKSYVSIPTRPPMEEWVKPAGEKELNLAYQVFIDNKINVELITGYEGNEFSYVNDIENELLSILSVHPMTKEAIKEFLIKAKTDDFSIIKKMIEQGKIVEIKYSDKTFYLRKHS